MPKGLLSRELKSRSFRKKFELSQVTLQLEFDILSELERRKWSYAHLAKLLGTSKGNISRDFHGGLIHCTLSRLKRYADALDLICDFSLRKGFLSENRRLKEALEFYYQDDLRSVEQGILESADLRPAKKALSEVFDV